MLDLLGPNLEELFAYCGRQFSLKTILLIGLQLVTRVERIHSRGLVFRSHEYRLSLHTEERRKSKTSEIPGKSSDTNNHLSF